MMFRASDVLVLRSMLFLLHVTSVLSTAIQEPVVEESALVGTNASLHCEITDPDDIQFVLWKKIYNSEHDLVLIHNNHTTDVDKYEVDYPHGLIILDVQVDDEALYQCEVNNIGARTVFKVLGMSTFFYELDWWGWGWGWGWDIFIVDDEALYQSEVNNIGARTVFKVLVPVSNLTLAVEGDRRGGGPFNLTCQAQHARPPATLTWFRGTSDVTARTRDTEREL
ncbi:uncharacterized protein [Littorina saxatilis]|uniref:uncharacterized protein n=1 Tax=Littorina saxatilis TaxID=31220 RepID=UPI0038B4E56A